uniref:Uncharacterized protein n=1 Tax=Nelumbo nucifera TaxID=4432 RepID=A0A822YZR9_NELNU|nr:TPA_asm: hypothetical protein HUJ06_008651 [Nelumbo nucifera]
MIISLKKDEKNSTNEPFTKINTDTENTQEKNLTTPPFPKAHQTNYPFMNCHSA